MTKIKVPFGLVPYGLMSDLRERSATEFSNGTAGPVLKEWRERVMRAEVSIAKRLWPRWSPQSGNWLNDKAINSAPDLIKGETDVFPILCNRLQDDAPRAKAVPSGYPIDNATLFRVEDGWRKDLSASGYELASATEAVNAYPALSASSTFMSHLDSIGDAEAIYLKSRFRRSRPSLAALLSRKRIPIQYAQSSIHPSMISGHALESMMAFTNAYVATRAHLTPNQIEDAKALAVGAGDRRVYAAVHFPSDNFGSWITAMYLAKYYWRNEIGLATSFMLNAIHEYSGVFASTKGLKVFDACRSALDEAFASAET